MLGFVVLFTTIHTGRNGHAGKTFKLLYELIEIILLKTAFKYRGEKAPVKQY
jgi:hypothetical protein